MNKIAGIIIACTLIGLGTRASADPPEGARNLARFIGTWSGKGTVRMDGQTAPVSGKWTCLATSGGFGIRCQLQMKGIPGMATYDETDIMGYDAGDGLVHWYSVTSSGETHDHRGNFDGDSFQATFAGPSGGQLFSECNTFKFKDRNHIDLVSISTVGQKPGPVFTMSITRAPAKSASK